MSTKIMKYQIIKPIDTDWNTLGKVLNQLQHESRTLANKTIQMFWDFQELSFTYKERFGEYLKMKDLPNKYTSVEGDIANELRDQFYKLPSYTLYNTIRKAKQKWDQHRKDILKGDKSIVSFKKGFPIQVREKQIQILKVDNNYFLKLSLLSKEYKKEIDENRKDGMITVLIKVGDNSQKVILDRLLNGEYKICGSEIMKHKTKNKWFINLTYTFEKEENQELDSNNIMGIDLGINTPVYMAFNNSLDRYSIEGNEIKAFRSKIEARRNSLLKQGKYCGDGRIGHGITTRIKPIEKLRGKVENFKNTLNHKYSKYIIDMAIKNNCGIIQMENLTGIASNEKKATFLGDWTYYDLQQKIKYKAEEKGIKVIMVKPNHTSARCSKCGYVHNGNNKDKWRPKQEQFKCMNCDFGHKYFVHADYNAAKNIATKDIEKIIETQLKKQDDELKSNMKYVV